MKQYVLILLSILLLTKTSTAQEELITIDKGCSYYGEAENKSIYVRKCQDAKVLKIIDDVLSTVSLQRNFTIYEANINNAIATRYRNDRLIIVDPKFFQTIEAATKDKYTSYLIIAHEIGHHLNAHTEQTKNPSPWWDELEADQFAGAVIQKLGISSATINNVINLIAPEFSNSKTHPEWQARMKACINGYCQSYFLELKRKVGNSAKVDAATLTAQEMQFEQFLNSKIYNKADWERNIKYKVSRGKIYKLYETNFYDDKEQTTFRKKIDTIYINKIAKIYLRWHDPGEVAFETSATKYQTLFSEANSETVNIETLQGKEAVKRLNPSYYFDDEVTISDDLAMLLKINNHVATLQKMYELYNSKR